LQNLPRSNGQTVPEGRLQVGLLFAEGLAGHESMNEDINEVVLPFHGASCRRVAYRSFLVSHACLSFRPQLTLVSLMRPNQLATDHAGV
jgi:hypothetical protein